MNRRFFSETPITGDSVTLADSEAHHLLHVLRATVGDQVTLFDGSGHEFAAEVSELGRREVGLRVVSKQVADRESPRNVTLAVALPKGDRQKTLVEKCVELGVATLIPLTTERGVAQPKMSALQKLRRGVIEASKQCGRNRLMEISRATAFSDLVQSDCDAKENADALRVLAHPYDAVPLDELLGSTTHGQPIHAAIGPEGGFSDDEIALAVQGGWQPIQLGARILRIETAAIAIAARLAN